MAGKINVKLILELRDAGLSRSCPAVAGNNEFWEFSKASLRRILCQ